MLAVFTSYLQAIGSLKPWSQTCLFQEALPDLPHLALFSPSFCLFAPQCCSFILKLRALG